MTILAAVKIDLGIVTNAYDARLEEFIEAARKEITREGVTLTEDDDHLVAIYTEWLWRRRDSGEGMPRMVRYALNNRVFAEKMAGE